MWRGVIVSASGFFAASWLRPDELIQSPITFAQSTRGGLMDVLSEVLKVVKLQGALFYKGEFSAPWCVNTSSARALAQQFAPTAEHVIIFHLLTHGRAFVRLESGEREILNAGDLVMIPHGDPHVLGNGAPRQAVNDSEQLAEVIAHGLRPWRM